MLEVTVKVWPGLKEKKEAAVGMICRKGRL